ncbi:hypothetical protein AX16_001593 [Volvariella volvacea WC 439]|nr:hypothetical protein AX16_001593 [Volvariella volvacea WC 439]
MKRTSRHRSKNLFSSLLLLSLSTNALAYKWPSPQYDTLETLLYEGRRGDGSSLASLVHPCRRRIGTRASIAAEWLRTAFHDMATYDASAGTGGLDGSIAFELDRAENFGVAFNQTLVDYLTFSNKYVSRSDIIALGTIFASTTCGGPVIPFHGGRIDASVAGPPGVPEPQNDIQTMLNRFSGAGFSQSEMIALTACGHTIGGVRSTDFPDLVPSGSDPNVPIFENFDSTEQFDNAVVTEYLDGTTTNPLVVNPNQTMVSDLKIFASDGNATVHSLADPESFANTCRDVLLRMINTVPSNVNLTEDIALLPVKVSNVLLTIERDQLVFKASLRLSQQLNDTTTPRSRNITMYWCDRYGDSANCDGTKRFAQPVSNLTESNISPVTQALGYSLTTYNFVVPVDPQLSVAKFWFTETNSTGDGEVVHDNGGTGYEIEQDTLLFVPAMSNGGLVQEPLLHRRGGFSGPGNYTMRYKLVAAVRDSSSSSSRVYMNALDTATNTFVPYRATVDFERNTSISSTVPGYTFYSAEIVDTGFYLTFDLYAEAEGKTYGLDFLQTTFLDNTPYVPPSGVQATAASAQSPTGSNSDMKTRGLGVGASLVVAFGGMVLGMFL